MHVYADNAATTRVSKTALDAMLPYFTEIYGNPSSLHSFGQEAKEALENARERIAGHLGCQPREVYFTSGGTEADNMAIRTAAALGARKNKRHIISTAFEHHAVLHTLKKLEKEGFEVTLLDVKDTHNITAEQVKAALRLSHRAYHPPVGRGYTHPLHRYHRAGTSLILGLYGRR